MSSALRLLLCEDVPDDAALIIRELRRGGYEPAFERVETAGEFAAALERGPWDLVIADYSMPRFSAPAALDLLKQRNVDLPFIIVSGSISEELAVSALKAGAHDFVLKRNLARLIPAVQRELREAANRADQRRTERALHEREAYLRAVLDNVADGIITIDDRGTVESFSSAAHEIFGYAASEVLGRNLDVLLAEESHGILDDCLRGAVSNRLRELSGRRRDGTIFPMELKISTTVLDERLVLIAIARDITARKRAEEQIRRQLDRLAALRDIDLAITGSVDLRVALNIVLEKVTSLLHVDAASVLKLNPHTKILEFGSGRGFRTGALRFTRLRLGDGFAGRAGLERESVTVPDLMENPGELARSPMLADEGFVAYHATPLVAKGEIKGVLEIFHRQPLVPDQDWLDFLDALSLQAAVAIDNGTLFVELERSHGELALAYDTTLEGWSRALDLRDKETEGHTQRVTEMTVRLSRAMGMSDAQIVHIRRGALLHDIGKMGVPDRILLKPGPLTEEEWRIMRKHPVYAHDLLAPIAYLRPALDIPYCHHEKWDGTGYPRGLKGEAIPLEARIFAVVDVWDALRSERPYRAAWPEEDVREHIRSAAGSHFDPEVVRVFLDMDWRNA